MKHFPDAGQSVFTRRRGLTFLGLLGCAVLGGTAWYLHGDAALGPATNAEPAKSFAASPESAAPPLLAAITPVPQISAATPPNEPEVPVTQLERKFEASGAKEERIEIVAEIAGRGGDAAVATLGRLFQAERLPAVKVALLSNLNDINHETAPELRLRLLTSALRGQARDVRMTALDSLAQFDDPQVTPLLKQAMTADPDHEVRDLADTLYHARAGVER